MKAYHQKRSIDHEELIRLRNEIKEIKEHLGITEKQGGSNE